MSTRRKVVLAVVAFVLLGGLVVFVPALQKYLRRAKTSEATMKLRSLFDASITYFTSEHCPLEGSPCLERRFPSPVGLTPAAPFCRDGEPFTGPFDASTWNHPTWRSLKFAPEGPLYFRYTYVSTGTGADAAFTVRAVGDLDCDGVLSTFERVSFVDDDCAIGSQPHLN